MEGRNEKRGNMAITYLFPEKTNLAEDEDTEAKMEKELKALLSKWVEQGYIRRFSLVGDEILSRNTFEEESREIER